MARITHRSVILVIATATFLAQATLLASAVQRARFVLDENGQVLKLSNLFPNNFMCPSTRLNGRVVTLNYPRGARIPEGVVVEKADGTRIYLRVDVASLVQNGLVVRYWVAKGLRSLLRKGRRVSLGVKRCAAVGPPLLYIDTVR